MHPGSIQYIEAHGTGTPVGDPIETNALGKFFGPHFKDRKVKIGSVKTNIGHLESAAGVAGIIKVLLMMKHGHFVPSLHADEPNKNIPFQEYGFTISRDNSKWKQNSHGCRIASINSFGFGGTNSHAIIYSNQSFNKLRINVEESNSEVLFPKSKVVVFSAVTKGSLRKMMHEVKQNLTEMSSLEDLSYTSVFCRDHFKFRKLMLTDSVDNLQKQLQSVLEHNEQLFSPVPSTKPDIVFVYCGVGTTWKGMCAEMIKMNPVFRKSIIEIDSYLKMLNADISIYQSIQNEAESYTNPILAHIAIFSTQLALAASWKHIGIRPSAVVGQSVGEVAAAYESGALSLEDAVTVIYYRSLALSTCEKGAMMVVRNCSTETVDLACAKIQKLYNCHANVAVYNSTESCTVSGDKETMERLKAALGGDTEFIPLNTSCAYHSHYTQDAGKNLPAMLESIKPQSPCIPTFSTVTGKEIKTDFASPAYWACNVSKPVLFFQSMKSVKQKFKSTIFLEIGPRPVFQAHFDVVFPQTDDMILSSINKLSEIDTFFNSLNEVFRKGISPIWTNVADITGSLSVLPTYVFSKNDCSVDSGMKNKLQLGKNQEKFAGRMVSSMQESSWKFGFYISKSNTPFVYEHLVDDKIILPGALYGEIALEIGRKIWSVNVEELEISWKILTPLEIGMAEEKYLVIDTDFPSSVEVKFKVRETEQYPPLAEGTVKHVDESQTEIVDVTSIDGTLGMRKSKHQIYSFLNALGFNHGSTFRIISEIQSSTNENLADIILTKAVQMDMPRTCFHPVIIDGMFQSCCYPTLQFQQGTQSRIFPTLVRKFTVKQPPTKKMTCFSRLMLLRNSKIISNVLLLRGNGTIVAEMQGFEVDIISSMTGVQNHFLEEKWQLIDIPSDCFHQNRPSLIASWNEQTMTQAKEVICRIYPDHGTVNLSDAIQRKHFLSTLPEQKNIDLYFIPGFVTAESFEDGDEVLECVQKSAHILLTILQKIDLNTMSLYIVTEWTQGGEDREVFGVFGSELWGIGRCFHLEHRDFKLAMIDLHGNWLDLQNSILSTISSLRNDAENSLSRELIISSKGVLSAKLQHSPSIYSVHGKKTVAPSKGKHYSVQTRSTANQPPYSLIETLETASNTNGVCIVSIHEALLCFHDHLYPFQKPIPVTKYWGRDSESGHPALACEFTGHSLKNGKEIIGCCLINVASSVAVNRLCVCELLEIPCYRMGMFFNMVVAMCLADKVQKKNNVFLLHDEKHKEVSMVLRALLQSKHCSVTTDESNIAKDSQDSSASVLVVLSKQVTCPFEVIIRWFPNIKLLLSIKGLLPISTTANDPTNYPNTESCVVDMFEIFQQSKMQKQFKRAKRLMFEIKGFFSNIPKLNSERILRLSVFKEPTEIEIPSHMLIRRDSAYVVIGGLTGLGWEVTKFLAARGAKFVITLSRRSPSEIENRRIENIKCIRNTSIWHDKVDITQKDDLERVFSRLVGNLGITKIRGIFHGAGVLQDAPVYKLTTEMFDVPLIPKILGTWNLHRVTENMDLDYFIMHSSIASLVGNKAQANYAAGNAFMDAFAHYRRSIGKAAQVINWGMLSVGMGADQNIQSISKMHGYNVLPKEELVIALNCALVTTKAQFTVADLNTSILEKRVLQYHESPQSDTKARINVHPELCDSKEQFRQRWLDLVKTSAASILSVEQDEIKNTSILLEIGLDSQKSIELINSLFESSQIRLPVVYLMTGKKTVTDIANYFLSQSTKERTSHDDVFISESPSPLELHYLELFETDCNNPHLTIAVDLTVSWDINDAAIWKTSLLNLILKNPELRTIFQPTEPGKKRTNTMKSVLDIEDVCFDFVTVSSNDQLQKVFKDIAKFDPYVDIPIKCIFWKSPSSGVVRLILNHCNIDNGSIRAIVKDFHYFFKFYLYHQCFPEVIPQYSLDPALVMEKYLKEETDELKSYWNIEVSKCKKSQSFEAFEKVEEIFNDTNDVISNSCNGERKENDLIMTDWSANHNTKEVKQLNGDHNTREVLTERWSDMKTRSQATPSTGAQQHNKGSTHEALDCDNTSEVISKHWSGDQIQKLKDASERNNVSLFSLFCTAYQLTLSKKLQCERICVVSAIDTRLHFPEFRDRITMCVNYVPMVSPDVTNSESTFYTVLTDNKTVIVDGIAKSALPFKLIKELPNFKNDIHMTHSITMEDLTLWNEFNSSHIQLSEFGAEQDQTYETCLSVIILSTRSLEFRLRYSLEKVGRYNAEKILQNIDDVLQIIACNPNMRIHSWQPII
ncbi:uncharacterized protein LOC125654127 isoform X2 [Ostrea edulis]|nr:uncharacterized protein LOC125654127 isoform X2 [Ostrea edulis]